MADMDVDRALDTVLASVEATRVSLKGRDASESPFDDAVRVAGRRLGDAVVDDRSDRASIDTWYPDAARFAGWVHGAGFIFVALERPDASSAVIVVGHATDEEITLRRRYRGHLPGASPVPQGPEAAAMPRAAAALGLGVWGMRHARRRPEGLNRLSHRRRDVAIRWLVFLGLTAVLVIVIGGMILARRPG